MTIFNVALAGARDLAVAANIRSHNTLNNLSFLEPTLQAEVFSSINKHVVSIMDDTRRIIDLADVALECNNIFSVVYTAIVVVFASIRVNIALDEAEANFKTIY